MKKLKYIFVSILTCKINELKKITNTFNDFVVVDIISLFDLFYC